MTCWFVSRHPGALEWARQQGLGGLRQVPHLDPARLAPGDVVVGTLPLQLAAAVCARGCRYLALVVDLPAEARGRELSAAELDAYGARLEAFVVRRASRAAWPASLP